MEVTDSGKHSSLLDYVGNYCRKKFYSTDPGSSNFILPPCEDLGLFNFLINLQGMAGTWTIKLLQL